MNKKLSISQKLKKLILLIVIIAIIVSSGSAIAIMISMRSTAIDTSTNDAINQLTDLASNKANMADSMLRFAQNQTILVAEGATHILENADSYLKGYNEESLPDLLCANTERQFVTVAVPTDLLENIVRSDDETQTVINATLIRTAELSSGYTVNEELFLGSFLENELAQIYRFRTPGTEDEYKGFAASYFCFDDSGIDIFGDPKTSNQLIEYDARTRGWYVGAVEAWKNGTLTESGVYWAEPFLDAAGRGSSMVCSAPVIINGKLVGVAGSGGTINDFSELVESTKIGSTGFSFMVSRNTGKVVISPNTTSESSTESEISIGNDLSTSKNPELVSLNNKILKNSGNDKVAVEKITIDGKECYVSYFSLTNNDWTLVTVIETGDDLIMKGYNKLNRQILTAFLIFLGLVVIIIVAVTFISGRFAKSFTTPILNLKKEVDTIGNGNIDHVIDIKTNDEIEELGKAFNDMTCNLNNYIRNLAAVTAEKERIGAELDVATHIQASMLPCIFPAFPDRDEFDIYATMNPAKEVGGDFYDFFMVDDTHIAIVMADVSGKGVPAALFMVIAKTLIKDHSQPDKDLGEVFSTVNNLLCESNSEGLFVTAFEGVLDLVTGEFKFVNAGHEMPFICKKDGFYNPYKIRAGFVLAGMEEMHYKSGSITLEPGDKIFQYTDGVTEATNANNELYGMKRLGKILEENSSKSPIELLPIIKNDIDAFVGEAPQFDDITMLCLEYKKRGTRK